MFLLEFILDFFVEVILKGIGYILGKALGYSGASIMWVLGGGKKPIKAYLELEDYGYLAPFIGLIAITGILCWIFIK
ncbi:MAG: hypothetical protein IPO07_06225 [Haliscomenobacter sp.]|uniref:Uncharacterized protein n=1 Tax=Haliscomenobacter hydrossis (strain ATCC 27775 / DSM 1100 / LMG 10767 / O) TaxID=760192 RepID=F4L5C7_HALH1|nr:MULTISPECIES: hypothetical protein [Haliscomenobacter]AEE49807.1 hypothetical protein Halhy_1922 [Haliscomenobacter hydrossis DSM 1100]MBK9488413.1 hypothetical protein [Haliscomenobacter sp.]